MGRERGDSLSGLIIGNLTRSDFDRGKQYRLRRASLHTKGSMVSSKTSITSQPLDVRKGNGYCNHGRKQDLGSVTAIQQHYLGFQASDEWEGLFQSKLTLGRDGGSLISNEPPLNETLFRSREGTFSIPALAYDAATRQVRVGHFRTTPGRPAQEPPCSRRTPG